MVNQLSPYKMLLNKLFTTNLHGGMKLGLDNIEKIDAALGNPSKKFKSIHIAGTNGKGSVSTKIAKALELEGYRVGLFTSPHISTFRERIKINGQLIDEHNVIDRLEKIFHIIETENIPATFFELTTALAFDYFADQKVDYAILEVGLGGRLDATNIVIPKLSVITSISLEHTEQLGHTLEEIATEKAGIIKPSIPVIIGPCVPNHVIEKIAKERHSPITQVTGHFECFDDENNAIAKKTLELLGIKQESITRALKELPPCRLQVVKQDPTVILDVAHNPDGLEHLFQSVKKRYPQASLRVVFGLSKTKDIDACLHVLQRYGDHFHPVEAANGRGLEVQELFKKMKEQDFSVASISIDGGLQQSIHHAVKSAKEHKQVLIICGTFFIMSEARALFGIDEPRDDYDMNEVMRKEEMKHKAPRL